MTKIIPTKFPNTKCRACGKAIEKGENVRWTKGEKGVTCVTCPGVHTPSETPVEALTRRFHIVEAEANTLRAERDELRAEVTRLRSAMAHELQLATQRAIVPAIDDGSYGIDVMAAGGVEAWLEYDLQMRDARLAAAHARVAKVDRDAVCDNHGIELTRCGCLVTQNNDDCPI